MTHTLFLRWADDRRQSSSLPLSVVNLFEMAKRARNYESEILIERDGRFIRRLTPQERHQLLEFGQRRAMAQGIVEGVEA